MSAGEYAAVGSQRDAEQADTSVEERALRRLPAARSSTPARIGVSKAAVSRGSTRVGARKGVPSLVELILRQDFSPRPEATEARPRRGTGFET